MEVKILKDAPRPHQLACIKFWVVVAAIIVLLLWVCAMQLETLDDKTIASFYYPLSFPSERVYKNNGYLMISCNGGLNQKRLAFSDMVVVARYLNATLILPEFANGSYWNDNSTVADIFDVDYLITSLRDEVHILRELPAEQKRRLELEYPYSMRPVPYASLSYYHERVLPHMQRHGILKFTRTDYRLANNGLPEELQKLRCRVNYEALRFTQRIEETGRKFVNLLKQKGPYIVLHLRYEKDMLSFSGCTEGLTREEAGELKEMRYSHDGWAHRPLDGRRRREKGFCPLTPEETALALQALGIDRNTTIYLAAGEIYNKDNRMVNLTTAYPNLIGKENVLNASELMPFLNHLDQMAALDYIVALESDVFIPTFDRGNMAKAVEGHRRYLGFRTTILPNRKLLVSLIDEYRTGTLSWDEFSLLVKKAHENRMGKPERREENPYHPSYEDYFYSNPQECLPPFAEPAY
ncbi:hypothetical protein SLEP1_g38071 [Rubroshorea leprosula]|uniref:O-fucosyltransferase family protein n=1 Tax=Rubroshorea leprosula TaxID=152421 RepID=A0AAV5KWP3_9ROSI|nr:hypothetical protein SLEP1_g38071 [Rubroshorea leprosula]